MEKKLGGRKWLTFILLGLFGQFAWTIENMYFNVFLYSTISTDPRYISGMVGFSAAAAVLTTILMGTLSDRVGKRKAFICAGYILWGLSTAIFGLITPENAARLFPGAQAAAAAANMVIIMDCVMTFFGSTANDAAFNAYVTDATTDENRGKVESVLATLPLISMLVIFGLFDGLTQQGLWKEFFGIFGAAVSVMGVLSIFLVKDEPQLKPKKDSFKALKEEFFGFNFSNRQETKPLRLSLDAFFFFATAVQVFFPYLIIYIQNYLCINDYAIVLGIVLIFASIVSVIAGRFIDRIGKLRFTVPAAIIMFAGLIGMFFARGTVPVIIAGSVMMSGYMMLTAALGANIRDNTPKDKVGMFQGVRMLYTVFFPMIFGPNIGALVIMNSPSTYVELGQVKSVPTPGIFLAAAVVLLFTAIPLALLKRESKKK